MHSMSCCLGGWERLGLDSSGGATDINHRYDMGGNASVVQFNLGYVQLYRPDSFCAATKIISERASVQYILILQQAIMLHGVALATTRSTNAAKPLLSREDLFDCSHKNGDFGAISVTERSSASSVLKVERYISPDRFCAVQCEQLFGLSLK